MTEMETQAYMLNLEATVNRIHQDLVIARQNLDTAARIITNLQKRLAAHANGQITLEQAIADIERAAP